MSAASPAIRSVPRILGIRRSLWIGRGVGLTHLVFMIRWATGAIDASNTSRCGVELEHRTQAT